MHDLTGFQRDCLYVIAGLDDPHGLAIKERLEDYYEGEVHHGRLYPKIEARRDWESQFVDLQDTVTA